MSIVTEAKRTSPAFTPIGLVDVELTRPLPDLSTKKHDRHQVLVRLHTEPIGVVEVRRSRGTSDIAEQIWAELGDAIVVRAHAAGEPAPTHLTPDGLTLDSAGSPYLRRRTEVLADAPHISVILATRGNRNRLDECLHRLTLQRYPHFEIVLVDNAPMTSTVREVAARWTSSVRCYYVAEPRPGLSWARNAGVRAATGDILAFIDDDESADPYWLAELARGFTDTPGVGCVGGVILPAVLDTRAQLLFEQLGGHSKGRGFVPAVFDADSGQSPLFPLPPFAAGGNMAFTRAALHAVAVFDVALGCGTPARGGEDTLAFTRVLLAGYAIAYRPSALVRHHHYEGVDGLRNQLHGYGVGLTAYYTALLRHNPRLLPPLLLLAPHALRELFGGSSLRAETKPDLPPGLTRAQRTGMLSGPFAYLRSLRVQARTARLLGGEP